MGKPHKWAKEIRAWADGAEIQYRWINRNYDDWLIAINVPDWDSDDFEFRIKPQPKESRIIREMKKAMEDLQKSLGKEQKPKCKREIYWNETEEKYCSRKVCECGDYDEIIPNQTTIDAINEARQFKEPQYLYVWKNNIHEVKLTTSEPHPLKEYASNNWKCVGKIKLEVDE